MIMSESVKTYSVYDGSNRLIQFYEAHTDASDGDKCRLTTYTFDGASDRLLKSKESLATWSSAWDI
jgi:hypothetical protein